MEQIEKIKVVLFCMFGGSWTSNMLEIAQGLIQSREYEVTIVGSYELDSKI